jgi:uncharacterized protein YchJ
LPGGPLCPCLSLHAQQAAGASVIAEKDGLLHVCLILRKRYTISKMVNLEYSVTSWGSPTAPKRALLLHGMMGTGAVFFKVAEILIKNGETSLHSRSSE